jgi:CRP-like cAMP-binding protein
MEKLDHKFMKGLAPDEIAAITRLCKLKSYSDTTCLFKENAEAKRLYLLLEGQIELRFEMPSGESEGTTITVEGAGETIGWSALVPPGRYHFSGYCKTKIKVLEIDRNKLLELLETNHHTGFVLMRNVATLIGERLYKTQDKLAKKLGHEIMDGW